MPAAASPRSAASALKKMSIGLRSRRPELGRCTRQAAILDAEHGIGRQHMHDVRLDHRAVGGDAHGEVREADDHLVQPAFPLGAEMGDDDDAEAGTIRQAAEKALQRLDPARRGADADNRIIVSRRHWAQPAPAIRTRDMSRALISPGCSDQETFSAGLPAVSYLQLHTGRRVMPAKHTFA